MHFQYHFLGTLYDGLKIQHKTLASNHKKMKAQINSVETNL